MDQEYSYGLFSLTGLTVLGVAYFVARRFMPTIAPIILWIFCIVAIIIAVQVGIALYFAFYKVPKTPEQEREDMKNSAIKKVHLTVVDLQMNAVRVRDQKIRTSAENICATMEMLLTELKNHPNDLQQVLAVVENSAGTLGGILKKYIRMEQGGSVADAVSASTAESLQSMERLMNKQYADLLQKDMAQVEQNMGNLTQVHQKRDLLEEKTEQ